MPLKLPAHMIGEWHHPKYGKIKMDQQKIDEMKRNFADGVIGRKVFVRIGHDKADKQTFGDAPAEAVVTELMQEGDVLYALAEPNDDKAAELIRSGRYRYISPEYNENYISKLDGSPKGAVLEAIALTNEPFLPGLPENRLLADHPDGYILNFGEVQQVEKFDQLLEEQKQTNGLLKKLADGITGLFNRKPEDNQTPTPTPAPASNPPATGILDPETQKKLADMQAQLDAAAAMANVAREAQRVSEIERKLSDYVNAGVPPVYVDQARKILLGEVKDGQREGGVIKLADDSFNKSVGDVYAMLDNFPQAARVPLNKQFGAQGNPPADDFSEQIKLCDMDMAAIGYKKDEQGRYVKL